MLDTRYTRSIYFLYAAIACSHHISSQAGITVQHDLTFLRKSYGGEGTAPADFGQLAGENMGIGVGEGVRSLEGLGATMLGRRLSNNSVRTNEWEKPLPLQPVLALMFLV